MINYFKSLFQKHPLKLMMGQFVEVVMEAEVTVTNDTEDGHFEKSRPMILAGYLTRVGSDHITLGPRPGLISDYIQRTKIIHVSVSKEPDEYDAIMGDDDAPRGEAGFN